MLKYKVAVSRYLNGKLELTKIKTWRDYFKIVTKEYPRCRKDIAYFIPRNTCETKSWNTYVWQGWKHAGKVHRGKSWYEIIVTWNIIQSVTMIIEIVIWIIFQMQSPFTTISRRMIKINFYSMNIDDIWLGGAWDYGWKPVKKQFYWPDNRNWWFGPKEWNKKSKNTRLLWNKIYKDSYFLNTGIKEERASRMAVF